MERLDNLLRDRLNGADESIQLNVEIYTEDNKYRLFISHDGSSGVRYNNINTSNDIAKCVEDYLDSNF